MDPVVLLALVAGFIAFVCAFIASYQGRRFPRSIAKQAEEFKIAVDTEKAIREHTRKMITDWKGVLEERQERPRDPYAVHPEGLDPATLTAAELQWLATSGLLPWAGEELARRTEQATELVKEFVYPRSEADDGRPEPTHHHRSPSRSGRQPNPPINYDIFD